MKKRMRNKVKKLGRSIRKLNQLCNFKKKWRRRGEHGKVTKKRKNLGRWNRKLNI